MGAHPALENKPRSAAKSAPLPYDLVYIRQPRRGDNEHITWPEVSHPGRVEPGSDLMLLHPDGSEEILVSGGNGAVTDPFVSFDAQWVYYAYFYDVRKESLNYQRGDLPKAGSDIFRIHVESRRIEQLTHQEFTPNTGAGNWDESNPVDPPSEFNRLGYGILNLGPAPIAGGKIVFTSNRNGFTPTKSYTFPTMQLFVMDDDGSNVTPIAPMTLGSALHPTPLRDGRILFSSFESQGLRDQRLWGIWSIWPDGRYWQPVVSAFKQPSAFHFMTQLGNDDIVVEDYYNANNWGFGALYRLPAETPDGMTRFYSSTLAENPAISQTVKGGYSYPFRMPFTPRGMYSISPFTHANDNAAPVGVDGTTRVGKFTHPSAAPKNDLLVVWSPGPANALNRPLNKPAVDAGLYLMPNGGPAHSPDDLILIKNDPNYNEAWPRALVPYRQIHGVDEPVELPWLPNDGSLHAQLPSGTPYGLVGTSSFYNRDSFPGKVKSWATSFDGLDAFNTSENDQSSNWVAQGSDAGKYDNAAIWAVRILAMEPNTHRSYGPNYGQHFFNHINEKLRILGEIPLRKFDSKGQPILDAQGNPDTSFLAKIPADTPFTFQMLDRNGVVLTMAQTWHQLRPGEIRTDCGGCHAHGYEPLPFEGTAANKTDYQVWNLVDSTPLLTNKGAADPEIVEVDAPLVNVEFFADIRPLLQENCIQCHTQNNPAPPANLVLDDLTLYPGPKYTGIELPGDYARLCFDTNAQWGIPPLVKVGDSPRWRQTNASRYIRKFQSRRSLLLWKIFGQRLDGWTNADHPTESVPGDAGTLPQGAEINAADLDFVGTIMPPPGSGKALTEDEKMTFARWIDLGCPINAGQGTDDAPFGWFLDDLRPTIALSQPRAGLNVQPLKTIRIGLADAYTGIDLTTLSVRADFALEGRSPNAELADLVRPSAAGDGIYEITLTAPLDDLARGTLHIEVADHQGNITRVNRTFTIDGNAPQPTSTPQRTPQPTRPGGTTTIPTPTPAPTTTPPPGNQRIYLPAVNR